MHVRLDELLSLRDGAPVDAGVRTHVMGCAECAAELARMRALRDQLRALPPVPEPTSDGWIGVRARLQAPGTRSAGLARMAPYAAAASLAALAVLGALRLAEWRTPATAQPEPLIVLETDTVHDWQERSRALEQLLAALPERPAVERAGTSVPIESLEAEVQWLDHRLSQAGADGGAPEAARLWRDRVEVMNSLVQLRYVEAQHVAP